MCQTLVISAPQMPLPPERLADHRSSSRNLYANLKSAFRRFILNERRTCQSNLITLMLTVIRATQERDSRNLCRVGWKLSYHVLS